MTFIDPYEIHVLSKPKQSRSKIIRTFLKQLNGRKFTPQNTVVHESLLIQIFIHGSRLFKKIRSRGHEKVKPSLITNHK